LRDDASDEFVEMTDPIGPPRRNGIVAVFRFGGDRHRLPEIHWTKKATYDFVYSTDPIRLLRFDRLRGFIGCGWHPKVDLAAQAGGANPCRWFPMSPRVKEGIFWMLLEDAFRLIHNCATSSCPTRVRFLTVLSIPRLVLSMS
jgi:hypothetical protein